MSKQLERFVGPDEETLLERARMAYQPLCTRLGHTYQQPNQALSDVEYGDDGTPFVSLANVNGPLAIYKYYQNQDRLKRFD